MAARRKRFELDPDYEDVTEQQNKRQRIFEEDAKEATVKRIKNIITEQFSLECQNKEKEINTIDQLIYQTKAQLDRLRACLVANYYGVSTQQKFPQEKAGVLQCPSIHPAVKQYLGKTPRFQPDSSVSASVTEQKECSSASSHNKDEGLARISGGVNVEQPLNEKNNNKTKELQSIDEDRRGSRFKIKKEIIVGNISKFIPLDKREENDQATHKWMVYVRGPKDKPRIDHFVKKIWFFMHPSYRPNDLVEISHAPFHLTRRGWGEFPIRVQLHFKDSRNKRVDIIHQLKLDRTYTGLQSLGAETVVEIEVERDSLMENDSVSNSSTAISSDHQCSKSSVVCEKMLIHSESLSLCKSKTISTGENDQTLDFISGKEDMFLSADNKNRHETSDMHLSNVKEALSENKRLAPKNTMHLKEISLTNRNYQQSTDSTLTNSSQENKSRTITISENDYLEINVNGNKLNDQDENLKDEKNVSFQSVQKPGWMEPTSVMRNISEDNKTLYSDLLGSNNMIAKENTGKSQIASPQKATTMSNVNKTTGPLSCFVVASKSDSAQTLSSSCLTTSHIFVQSSSSTSSSGSLAANSLQTNTHPSLLGSTRVSAVEKSGQPSSQKAQGLHWLPHNTYIKCRDREGKLYLVHPDMLSYKPAKTTSGMCALAEMSLKIANVKITANRSLLSAKGQDNTLVPLTPPNILQTAVAPNTEKNIAIGRCCKPAHQITTNNGKIESPVLKSPVADNKAPYKVTSHGLVALSSSHNNTGLPTVVINNTSSTHAGGTNSRPPFVIKTVNSRNLVSLLSNKLTRTGANLACLKVKQSTANTSSTTSGNSGTVSSPTVSGTLVLSSNQISVVPSANAHRTNQELNKGAVLSSEDSASLKTPPKTSEDLVAFKTANSGELVNSVTTAKHMIGLTVGSQKIVFQPLANQMHNIGQQRKTPVTKHCLGVGSVTQPIASSQLFSGSVKNPAVFGLKLEIKEKEKKIHVYKSKTKEVPSPVPTIEPLRLEFYPDMVSLLKASVKRHQLVSNDANHSLHPYRACCTEEWLQWNVGKRRASEWQRASSVRTFIQQQLGGTDVFKGEKVWTTKQIFTWCRLHTYSPHFLESAGRVQAEEPETSPVQMNSYSEASLVQNQVNKIGSSLPVISDSDEEIDILSLDVPKVRLKKDPEEYTEEKLLLSPTDEVIYVQETAQLIGIKFWPTEIIEGIYSHTAEMLIFTTMMDFMGDIIRLTFALKARKGRYPAELRMEDFHKALCSIPCADFLTNKYLGVLEDSVEKNLRLGEDGRTLGKAGVL